ncbi:MAG: hypothetical protein J0J01_13760 [Reyranella sp.]|uniref:hypothetical protein n=1 Tax=Reyranella sp. TaxID=1929291 RepID=UPI001AC85CFF|nr:hypothetical protein [Reyranella sp.]MBN9087972.1 hypothetical protein [Reyranella sp.]
MFGFTEGSDIGRRGDLEGEVETVGRFGRQASTYSAVSTTPTVKYGVTDQFRIAPAVTVSSYAISGLDGSADQNRLSFDAVSLEFRYHPLDRASAPVGLTFVATPFVGFTNPADGVPADRFGALFIAVADRALIPGQLYAALNLSYQLERDREQASGLAIDGSILGFNAAASRRLSSWLYLGGEARYLRAFSGLALDALAGQALYVGPTFYAPVVKGVTLSGAWDVQVWGQAADVGRGLDLTNFERHQVKLRLSFDL